jgi:hypothetical protein
MVLMLACRGGGRCLVELGVVVAAVAATAALTQR